MQWYDDGFGGEIHDGHEDHDVDDYYDNDHHHHDEDNDDHDDNEGDDDDDDVVVDDDDDDDGNGDDEKDNAYVKSNICNNLFHISGKLFYSVEEFWVA